MKNPKSILITGGNSGLGAALALEYAAPSITLFLCGRDAHRLAKVAKACTDKGATVHTQILTVTDQAAMERWIMACDTRCPLDLVVANAGIGLILDSNTPLSRHTDDTFAVNINGVLHTVHPALAVMAPRGRGQIALISSLAGYHGMPSAPAYSASKACIKAYGEALRGLYVAQGIAINVVCPGFIRTPMTDRNPFPMPFLMDADKAMRKLRHGLAANKARISFPWQMNLLLSLMVRLLPEGLLDRLLRQLPAKD